MKKAMIVIPARYGSTRFPGKPLASIAGKTMLERVVEIALEAAENCPGTGVLVATDDKRIFEHALHLGVSAAMTPAHCLTGTDRVYEALKSLPSKDRPEVVINFQGDAPLTSPSYLEALILAFQMDSSLEAVTPAVRLNWEALDRFRMAKEVTPFSGTTVTMDARGRALWFSKTIIPAIRNENRKEPFSPVYRHIGLYGYRWKFLEAFVNWPEGRYEQIEGLEQLRILERGHSLYVIEVSGTGDEMGIDTPEDLRRATAFLEKAVRPDVVLNETKKIGSKPIAKTKKQIEPVASVKTVDRPKKSAVKGVVKKKAVVAATKGAVSPKKVAKSKLK